jgi:hypothetical protein
MARFTWIDIFWSVAFLLLMVGGAALFYRLARRGKSDFFLAGRGLPWWLPASSVFSTHTATDTDGAIELTGGACARSQQDEHACHRRGTRSDDGAHQAHPHGRSSLCVPIN